MNGWPVSPPPMPPPGWYADPEHQWTWRYWDGAHWSDHRAPMGGRPTERDPYSFSTWFQDSIAAVMHVLRRAGVAIVAATLGASLIVLAVGWRLFDGRVAREIREILGGTDWFEADPGFEQELTDEQLRRLGELFGDLLIDWLPVLAGVAVVVAVVSLWCVTLAARRAWEHVDAPRDDDHDGNRALPAPQSIIGPRSGQSTLARLPAVLASAVVLGAIGMATMLPVVPFVVVLATDAGPGMAAITGLFGIVAAIVLSCWIVGRLALATVLAAQGGHGLGIGRSWTLTEGRYWVTVGRLIVAGLMASLVTTPFSFVGGFAPLLSPAVFVVVLVVLQAVSGAASVIVSTPAQVVLADQLARRMAERSAGEPSPGRQ